MSPPLSGGAILQYICKGEIPPPNKCTFQVIGTRRIATPSSNETKFRICISDGNHRFTQAVILLDDEDQVPPEFSIITLVARSAKNCVKTVQGRLILIIGEFKIQEKLDSRIGNPIPVPEDAFSVSASSSSSGAPGTPTASYGNPAKDPPPLSYKRPLDKSPNTQKEEDSKAKLARRNLFPTKATHCIKDLNPYQNKYTIMARVTKKSPVKTWNNSRGEGSVFDFVLKDASGEIKVTGFNEDLRKFEPMVQEGKVYYLSNAKIQPVRKPEYNHTNHNYELTLMSHTVMEPCVDKNDQVPSIEYNFVKIKDIENVPDKDKIDVLAICCRVEACVNQSLRSGRETKKREITVTDDSKAEIQLTLWGENAEKYGKEAIEGKVVAVRQVMVTDWNGKSLSCSFGSSIEVDPDMNEAKDLADLFSTSGIAGVQSLTRVKQYQPLMDKSEFVTLKEMHDEFQETSQTRYYNICAYLIDLKADKIMYKACPGEKCNKMVIDMGNGQFKCEKCRQEYDRFHWRYLLRGAVADATSYQWITMFDDSAAKIIGKEAKEMAEIKDKDELEYRRVLKQARYAQFNFSVKTSKETWNDENRLKVSVANAEPVDYSSKAHIDRIKAEIAALENHQKRSDAF